MKRRRKSKGNLAKTMREFAITKPMMCEHCGLQLAYWKYSNIDHIKSRGAHPSQAHSHDNMRVLCDDVDVSYAMMQDSGYKTRTALKGIGTYAGCHTLRHGNPELFEAKSGLLWE